MQLDRPRDEIARDLMARAESAYGAQRARALRKQIEDTAGWLSMLGGHPLPLDGVEPDFLVAPAREGEDR